MRHNLVGHRSFVCSFSTPIASLSFPDTPSGGSESSRQLGHSTRVGDLFAEDSASRKIFEIASYPIKLSSSPALSILIRDITEKTKIDTLKLKGLEDQVAREKEEEVTV